MTTHGEIVRTGRLVAGRIDARKFRCPGCDARMMYGEPRPNLTWPVRLRLDPETADLLLVAAAEFSELSAEAGEYESAVAFIDWVGGVTRLRIHNTAGPDHDGAPPRSEAGGPGHPPSQQRHPFPIPVVELPRKLRAG